jgi:hypothetical protein
MPNMSSKHLRRAHRQQRFVGRSHWIALAAAWLAFSLCLVACSKFSVRECDQDADCSASPSPCLVAVCTLSGCDTEPAASATSCAAGVCDGAGTCVACLDDAHCDLDKQFCKDATCEAKREAGQDCDDAVECLGGFCSGGSCCDTACAGSCESCQTGSCEASSIGAPGAPSCEAYLCDGQGGDCPDACSDDMGCSPGNYCNGAPSGSCVATHPLGQGCSGASGCSSGLCVDSVCCESECAALCFSCNTQAMAGSCRPHAAGTDPDLECAGVCDGVGSCVSGELDWSKAYGGSNHQLINGITVGPQGDVFVTGGYISDMTIGSYVFANNPSPDEADAFIAKLNADGSGHQWVQVATSTGRQSGAHIAVDSAGDVIVAGSFENELKFDPNNKLSPISSLTFFVAKFDGNTGAQIWAKTLNYSPTRLLTDSQDNVIVSGYGAGNLNCAGQSIAGNGASNLGVCKLESVSGDLVVGKSFGDNTDQFAEGAALDSQDNLILAATFNGVIDFGCGDLTVSSGSLRDVVMAKLDKDFKCLWSQSFGDKDNQYMLDAATDSADNILLLGRFLGQLDLGAGPLVNPDSSYHLYLARFDAAGKHLASKSYTANLASSAGQRIATDAGDNIIISGRLGGVDFGGGVPAGNSSLVKMTSSFTPLWTKGFNNAIFKGLTIDASGNTLTAGYVIQAVNFGKGPVGGNGGWDAFIAKFSP